eukprot:TRINITY_DN439_c0_g1_i1.p2 TRINITY_DN439_c0_g1~~TRINITY_DN439_c0_g1_i1.p2  ORF type:complete len:237 (+),score=80.55 TRINITY_DN439_c0_g1_i1:61-771(+)
MSAYRLCLLLCMPLLAATRSSHYDDTAPSDDVFADTPPTEGTVRSGKRLEVGDDATDTAPTDGTAHSGKWLAATDAAPADGTAHSGKWLEGGDDATDAAPTDGTAHSGKLLEAGDDTNSATANDAGPADEWTGTGEGPVRGTIDYPEGGRNYRNNEDVSFTIECNKQLMLVWELVDVETDFDFISLNGVWYNGKTATTMPDVMVGDLEIRFTSDGSITKKGFTVRWSCADGPATTN